MRKTLMVLGGMLAALPSAVAFADSYDDCNGQCDTQTQACMAVAKSYVNDIEVQDAEAACQKTALACTRACRDDENSSRGIMLPREEPQQ